MSDMIVIILGWGGGGGGEERGTSIFRHTGCAPIWGPGFGVSFFSAKIPEQVEEFVRNS